MRISLDWKGPYTDNIPEERLWRTVKHEVVYLKAFAYASGAGGKWEPISGSPMTRGPIKPWATGPQPRWSTEAGFPEGGIDGKENLPELVLVSLARAMGISPISTSILSNRPGPPQRKSAVDSSSADDTIFAMGLRNWSY